MRGLPRQVRRRNRAAETPFRRTPKRSGRGDGLSILRFENTGQTWWSGKPLVLHGDQVMTGELAVLARRCGKSESGVWMNSRGAKTGVQSLTPKKRPESGYRTVRVPLPAEVSKMLVTLYELSRLKRGCPDLLIWDQSGTLVRMIEVKGPGDTIRLKQTRFIEAARGRGIGCEMVEWGFL